MRTCKDNIGQSQNDDDDQPLFGCFDSPHVERPVPSNESPPPGPRALTAWHDGGCQVVVGSATQVIGSQYEYGTPILAGCANYKPTICRPYLPVMSLSPQQIDPKQFEPLNPII